MNATLPTCGARRKGHYLGTEVDGQWWRRYRKNRFLARGNGEYWCDDVAFYFRRYLTRHPIAIPFEAIVGVEVGNSHSGRLLFGTEAIRLIWREGSLELCSGFVAAKNPEETAAVAAGIQSRAQGAGTSA